MEKAKISRGLAGAIETLKELGYDTPHKIMGVAINGFDTTATDEYDETYVDLNSFIHESTQGENLITLSMALVNGYEIKLTPQEQVREYYNSLKGQGDYGGISREAIEYVAKIININLK